jgi:catechol 2,3-dioxygenase
MSVVQERSARVTSRLIDHIARVDLRVSDIESSLRFYRDIVGLEVAEQDDRHASLRAPGGPVFFTLDSTGIDAPRIPQSAGLFHNAILFPDRAALGDALARLAASGMAIGAGDHAVSEALYIDDPDGNGVELYRDRPEDEWPAPTDTMMVPMVTDPVDLRGVLESGRGEAAVGQPAAEGTGMGHVHLQVSDLAETVRFYDEELGLDLTGRLGGHAGFFSSNGYHHHLGANTWNSRGSALAPANTPGLQRIVFSVTDVEELEKARLRLGESGRVTKGTEGVDLFVDDPNGVELVFVASTSETA